MGKKIPSKKHRGVKDPFKQQEQRFAKIKSKINEAPEDIESQEIPKKLRNLFKKKQKRKNMEAVPMIDKKGKPIVNEFQPQRPLKKIPKIQRRPGESDKALLWRTELTTREYLKQARFEEKYDVDIERDEETGEVKMKKKDTSYLENSIKVEPQTKQERKKLKKLEKKQEERAEKLKLRKEKLKLRKLKKKGKKVDQDEFSTRVKQDIVEFGEVAQQPPSITAKPRKSTVMDKVGSEGPILQVDFIFY